MKKLLIVSVFSLAAVSALLVYAQTNTAAWQKYQAALKAADAQYKADLDAAQKIYETAVNAAVSAYNTASDNAAAAYQAALSVATTKTQRDKALDDYNAALTAAKTAYDNAINQAESALTAAKTAALQKQRQARDKARADYLGIIRNQTPSASPSGTPTPSGSGTPTPSGSGTPTPTASIPPNVTVTTMTPAAFMPRYGVYCGIANGPAVAAGATIYYKIDMANWIEWQRQYFAVEKGAVATRLYNMCMSTGAAVLSQYNNECDPNTGLPLHGLNNGVCATNECFALVMAGTCQNPPDPNYAQGCKAGLDGAQADADKGLKAKEDLYKTGSWKTAFSDSSGVGCNPYVGNAGCENQGNTFNVALGYNLVPVFEDIFVFSANYDKAYNDYIAAVNKTEQDLRTAMANCPGGEGTGPNQTCITQAINARDIANNNALNTFCSLAKQGSQGNVEANFGVNCEGNSKIGLPPISDATPIAAAKGYLNGSGTEGGPYASFEFSSSVLGADNVYLMIHNKEGAARTFEFEMYCPDAIAK